MQYLSVPVGRMQLSDPASRPTGEFRLSQANDQFVVKDGMI